MALASRSCWPPNPRGPAPRAVHLCPWRARDAAQIDIDRAPRERLQWGDGGGLEIIFNVEYLTDVLAVLDTPQVALELNSPQSPGVIRPVGARGEHYTYVIMPMHNTR